MNTLIVTTRNNEYTFQIKSINEYDALRHTVVRRGAIRTYTNEFEFDCIIEEYPYVSNEDKELADLLSEICSNPDLRKVTVNKDIYYMPIDKDLVFIQYDKATSRLKISVRKKKWRDE